jgi:hypothetical protein
MSVYFTGLYFCRLGVTTFHILVPLRFDNVARVTMDKFSSFESEVKLEVVQPCEEGVKSSILDNFDISRAKP